MLYIYWYVLSWISLLYTHIRPSGSLPLLCSVVVCVFNNFFTFWFSPKKTWLIKSKLFENIYWMVFHNIVFLPQHCHFKNNIVFFLHQCYFKGNIVFFPTTLAFQQQHCIFSTTPTQNIAHFKNNTTLISISKDEFMIKICGICFCKKK